MSADDKFKTFQEMMQKSLKNSGTGNGFCFDGVIEDLDALWEKIKRTEMITELKQRAQENEVLAKDWTPLVGRIDYMSVTERDLRMRFRNRVQNLRNRDINAALYRDSTKNFGEAMSKIESS